MNKKTSSLLWVKRLWQLLANLRLTLANRLALKLPMTLTNTFCRYQIFDSYPVANRMANNFEWSRLRELVTTLNSPLCYSLAQYLRLPDPEVKTNKPGIGASLRAEIKSKGLLNNHALDPLLDRSRFLAQFGFFEASLAFRVAALAQITASARSSENLKDQVALELAGLPEADIEWVAESYGYRSSQRLLQLRVEGTEKTLEEILAIYRLASARWLANKIKEFPDAAAQKARRFIENKLDLSGQRVLLMGPSLRTLDANLDFDKVMRIGYTGPLSTVDQDAFPTDIALYRDHKLTAFSTQRLAELFKNRDVILSNVTLRTMSRIPFSKRIKLSEFSGKILIGSESNAGVEGILVAIGSGAKSVYVANMDLLLNNQYPEGYIHNNPDRRFSLSGESLDILVKCRSFALYHPPISNYSIYANLLRHGTLSTDAFLNKVLCDGAVAYCQALEKNYYPFKQVSIESLCV